MGKRPSGRSPQSAGPMHGCPSSVASPAGCGAPTQLHTLFLRLSNVFYDMRISETCVWTLGTFESLDVELSEILGRRKRIGHAWMTRFSAP